MWYILIYFFVILLDVIDTRDCIVNIESDVETLEECCMYHVFNDYTLDGKCHHKGMCSFVILTNAIKITDRCYCVL